MSNRVSISIQSPSLYFNLEPFIGGIGTGLFSKILLSSFTIHFAMAVLMMVLAIPSSEANSEICSEPVETESGLVKGKAGKGYCEFKGIPFAQPPVGDLRWAAPQKPLPHEGVYSATKFGPDCLQLIPNLPNFDAGVSEDCLYLNVWRPAKPGKYPVMVWIYGGGLLFGAGSWSMYNGANLATRNDVIVVTLNYRLGPLGYLSHPQLKAEDPNGSHGNYGALDQVAALEWVKENISEFGGDSDNVTIFGESAGGWSVCTLMASPVANGLFHKAIIESGGCEMAGSEEEGFTDGAAYAKAIGCNDAEDQLACMRSKSANTANYNALKLIFSSRKINSLTHRIFMYRPNVDGYFLKDIPLTVLQSGEYNRVPLLAGSNVTEHKLFTGIVPMGLIPRYLSNRFTRGTIGAENEDEFKSLYTKREHGSTATALAAGVMDSNLSCGTFEALRASNKFDMDAYYYQFKYDGHLLGAIIGGAHALELPFVFDNLNKFPFNILYTFGYRSKGADLATLMSGYWANFAKTGNPNFDGALHWPQFDEVQQQKLYLDRESYVAENDIREKCEFWSRVDGFGLGDEFKEREGES